MRIPSPAPKIMLNKELTDIFLGIVKKADKLISDFVDKQDLTGKIDFLSIYTQSPEELKTNGSVADIQPTGNYYWLSDPLKTVLRVIRRCRVRMPDIEHTERGYVDFEVRNYIYFKDKYLQKSNFIEITSPKGVEMIELKVRRSDIRIYFPNVQF